MATIRLESLPTDLLHLVITLLPPPALSRLHRTSRRFRFLTTPSLLRLLASPFISREFFLAYLSLPLPVSFCVTNPSDPDDDEFDVMMLPNGHADGERYYGTTPLTRRETIGLFYEHHVGDSHVITPYPSSLHSFYQLRPSYRSLDPTLPTRLALQHLESTIRSLFSPFPLPPLPPDILSSTDTLHIRGYVSPSHINDSPRLSRMAYEVAQDLLDLRAAVDHITATPTTGDAPGIELGHLGETDPEVRNGTVSINRHLNEQLGRLRALHASLSATLPSSPI